MSTHDFVLELRAPATCAVPMQQLRNLVPHRAVDYGRMLARVADALCDGSHPHRLGFSSKV